VPREQPTVEYWESGNIDEHVELIRRQLEKSVRDPELRQLAVKIVSGKADDYRIDQRTGRHVPVAIAWDEAFRLPELSQCAMKDEACESQALWDFYVMNVRYVLDPDGYDLFATGKYTLLAGGGDCFAAGTLMLRDDYTFVPVEHLEPGMKIWGQDRWSVVEAAWPKGLLPISLVQLNNGSTLRLTEDHHVYVLRCPIHVGRKTTPCSCRPEEREEIRIRVSDLRPGMVLPQPARIPFGAGVEDPDIAYLQGLYLSDGWVDGKLKDAGAPSLLNISGQDGTPKEEQKRRVQAICERWGLSTYWNRKYIGINDAELAARFGRLGHYAWEKRVESLDLGEGAAGALLRGLMADSGANTHGTGRTFTTTSKQLALAVRVLHRMFGRQAGYRFIENHGGLGSNPIHRLQIHGGHVAGKAPKLLRVKAVDREILSAFVWDITTDDHRVYLPEHDVTVSQCDDATITLGALHRLVGFQGVRARVVSTNGKYWEHVYPMIGFPKTNPRKWLALDPTVKGSVPGWEYPKIKVAEDFRL
jgi:hypothetical protein